MSKEYYLKQDHTGASSGIEYGKKGDKVTLIKDDGTVALVDGGKELYHIRLEKLSEEKIGKEISVPLKTEVKKRTKKK